jgi:hypothetical protein
MGRKPKPHARRWRIILARKKGAELGTVEAPDAKTAIEVGAEKFDYPAWRLIAEEVG